MSNQGSLWRRMVIVVLMGFSSGLPLLLTGSTLKMWLAREGFDAKTIGFFSWVGLAYSLKFIWAPLMDRYQIYHWGRRRGWLFLIQAILIALIALMGVWDPKVSMVPLAVTAVLVAFFSATQDVVIDAYRREFLNDDEMGLGASMTTYGYRFAMLLSGGLGIGLVGNESLGLTWNGLYFLMAGLMVIGLITTIFIPEPQSVEGRPKSLREAVVEPFKEFFSRPRAVQFLIFVILFKIGDSISGQMLNKFYVDMNFSNQDVGYIAKTVGLISSLTGLFIGGLLLKTLNVYRALIFCGVLQGLSTGLFSILTFTGPQSWALAVVVVFEDLSSGMGSAAFTAFMALLTNRRFTATQFALLSSFATLGRNFFSGYSGVMVEELGWVKFFLSCALMSLPGILMAIYIHWKGIDETPQQNQVVSIS